MPGGHNFDNIILQRSRFVILFFAEKPYGRKICRFHRIRIFFPYSDGKITIVFVGYSKNSGAIYWCGTQKSLIGDGTT